MEPLTLYMFCTKTFGKDFLTWDASTRKTMLEKKLDKTVTPSYHNMLEAMVNLQVSDIAWKEYAVFEIVVWALNGYVPRVDIMEKPPSYFISYALYIMNAFNTDYSEEVRKYIAACLLDEGFLYAPPPLDIAQSSMDQFIPDKKVTTEVKKAWEALKLSGIGKYEAKDIEDSMDTQMSKLVMVEMYNNRKEELLKQELA